MPQAQKPATLPRLNSRKLLRSSVSQVPPNYRSQNDQRLASLKNALSVLSEVEPYASRGARTVPGGVSTARWAPTRLLELVLVEWAIAPAKAI